MTPQLNDQADEHPTYWLTDHKRDQIACKDCFENSVQCKSVCVSAILCFNT